jgi:uncharacterized repeat protein (TIGR01451 family)
MKKTYSPATLKQKKSVAFLFVFVCMLSMMAPAQFRKLGFVYSENLRGGAALFGNTLMYYSNPDGSVNTIAMNGNSVNGNSIYDNGNYGATNMQYVDIDGNTGEGTGTRNSSSADLILPAGTSTIQFARLYWGGRALGTEFNMTEAANQKIKIRKGTSGAYQEFPAAQIDRSVFATGTSAEYSRYQAFADITDLIKAQGAGTYTVGNGAFSTGTGGDFGNYGAWSIVVVYENPTLNFNSIRIIDGFQEVYSGGSATTAPIIITGLNIPAGGLAADEAQLGMMAWEGDARFNGDLFRVNEILLSDSRNQSNNPWNGTITINGEHVTTKDPNYTDQMGIDIDQFYVGTGYNILPNDSSVILKFGTNQDQYFSGVIAAVIKMRESEIKITKTVTDANNNQIAEAGEVLTYKIKGKNFSATDISAVVVTDSLPSTMNFVANSLKVNYCPGISAGIKTDGSGDDIAEYTGVNKIVNFRLGNNANSFAGGTMATTDSFEVEFKVTFNPVANGVAPPVINVARVKAKSATLENFIDDATVTIDGATAQSITYIFTGNGNWDVAANWINNRIPPATLPVFSTIIIDHIDGGQCLLNVSQYIATGASIIVNTGKSLVVPGALTIL